MVAVIVGLATLLVAQCVCVCCLYVFVVCLMCLACFVCLFV